VAAGYFSSWSLSVFYFHHVIRPEVVMGAENIKKDVVSVLHGHIST
jgi:hypothetical protein